MRRAIITLLICILAGLAFGLLQYFTYDPRPARILIQVASCVIIGSLVMHAVYQRNYLLVFIRHAGLKAVAMTGLLVAAGLLGTEITFMLAPLWAPGAQYHFGQGGSIYALNILVVLFIGIPAYVHEEWKQVAEQQISRQAYRVLQLEQAQTLFELELLRAKVNPHFLYNVHNTIAGLISKDPEKAETLVLLLSKFFRFTLNKNSATFHTISDELEIVRTYLHMQQIRFEDRMQYEIKVNGDALPLQIASFVLQPLVENAVKHGIEGHAGGGRIDLDINREADRVVIVIGDDGPAFPLEPGNGNGLQLVINKLHLLYADAFSLTFYNTPEKYVQLTIPLRYPDGAGR